MDTDASRDAPDDRLPAGTRIGRAALRVADLDETTAFYRDVVGLAVLDRDDDRATLGVDGTALLFLDRDPDSPERGPTDAGLFHIAFRVPSRAALGEALARVRDRWRLDGASDHLVSEALYLDDPEGNGVEISRDRTARYRGGRRSDGRFGFRRPRSAKHRRGSHASRSHLAVGVRGGVRRRPRL